MVFLTARIPRILTPLLWLSLLGGAWGGETFTLPIFPDTQAMLDARHDKLEMFTKQLQWIVQNRESARIPFVLHVGDIIDFDTRDEHMWKRASDGFGILDQAGIGYALANGNHDGAAVFNRGSAAPGDTHANVRHTVQFNRYFPVRRFTHQVDRFEGRSENAAYTFDAGGLKWLVVTLEFCCRQAPLDWAKTVLPRYPDHNVIILTHYHLNPAGGIVQNNAGYGDLSPQQIFDQFISRYSNVRFVFSGHVVYSATREDRGVFGNRILQMLQNYQSEDSGGGYLRLVEVDPQGGRISGHMYSPYYDKTREDKSRFTFDGVDFVRETALGADLPVHRTKLPAGTIGEPFEASCTVLATPGASGVTLGLGSEASLDAKQFAAAVRFDSAGKVRAGDQLESAASGSVPWVAGKRYLVQFAINPEARTYSAKVTAPDGTESVLARDLSFSPRLAEGSSVDTLEVRLEGTGGGAVRVSPLMLHRPMQVQRLAIAQELTLSGKREPVAGTQTIDGKTETYWVPAEGLGWIQYDLGTVKTIAKLKVAWRELSARGFHYDVQASTNLSTQWMPVLTDRAADATATDWETIDLPDIAARYLRLVVRYSNPEDGSGLAEAELWGF